MKCAACESTNHSVVNTRPGDAMIRRTRECNACRHRWTTVEVLAEEHETMQQAKGFISKLVDLAKDLKHGTPAHG